MTSGEKVGYSENRQSSYFTMENIPKVSDYMSEEIRSIHLEASLKEAGKLLHLYQIGALLVDDDKRYVGIITDSDLSRKAVPRGLILPPPRLSSA